MQQLNKSLSIHPPGIHIYDGAVVVVQLIHCLPYRDPVRQDVFAGAKAEQENISYKNLAVRQPKQTHRLVATDIIDTNGISINSTTIQRKTVEYVQAR